METKFKVNGVWKAAFQHFGESIGTWRSRIGPCIPAMPSWHRAIMASWHRGMLHGWWFTGFPISTPGCSTKWRQEGKHLKVTSDIKKQYYVPSWNHLQKLVSLDSLLLLKCIFFSTITSILSIFIYVTFSHSTVLGLLFPSLDLHLLQCFRGANVSGESTSGAMQLGPDELQINNCRFIKTPRNKP